MASAWQWILASASPRRRQLLEQLGLEFTVYPSDVDETSPEFVDLPPAQLVERLALAKASAVARRYAHQTDPSASPRPLVIGADTVVVLEDEILGKPVDADHARRMLNQLAGRMHTVYTGIALIDVAAGRTAVTHRATRVWLRPLPASWIDAYVATGEPLDKAGAYAVQGLGAAFVERIEGCYFNVVGLPLAALVELLEAWGIQLPLLWPAHIPRAERGASSPLRQG
ncbi:MAG TPA: Maf family protein [Bacillota bacterium]